MEEFLQAEDQKSLIDELHLDTFALDGLAARFTFNPDRLLRASERGLGSR